MAQPSSKTVKRLFAVSGNRCAFPGCEATLVDEQSGTVTAEICHIKAEGPRRPRYDRSQSDKQRRSYDNLILMCGDHHRVIDTDFVTYGVQKLRRIKAEHEKKWGAKRESAPRVTDDIIRSMIEHIGKLSPKLVDPKVRIRQARAQRDSELALLNPYRRATRLVGREQDLKGLLDWVASKKRVAVRILVGRAGAGKTRLALELMQELSRQKGGGKAKAAGAWRVGFLTADEMSRFRNQHGLAQWKWDKPTLLIVEYAAGTARELRGWLEWLASHPASAARKARRPPLRILLLERHANLETGWLAELTPRAYRHAGTTALFDPPEPIELRPIVARSDRRGLLQNALNLFARARGVAGPALPRLGQDENFEQKLGQDQWQDPIYLMMAAMLATDRGLLAALSLSRSQLGEEIARREIGRIEKLAGGDNEVAGLRVALAGLATLARGLDADQALEMARSLLDITAREYPGGPGKLADDTSTALAGPDRGIAAVVPDMVGEALVHLSLSGSLSSHQRNRLLLAAARLSPGTFKTLILLIQDYGQRWPQTLDWLDTLIRKEATRNVALLHHLCDEIPHDTVLLLEKAAEVAAMLVELSRKAITASPGQQNLALLAIRLNNLANRLSYLGKRQEALQTAQEAVDKYRKLADWYPSAFLPDLAISLNNLANMLSGLGQREQALQTTQEAVKTYRKLSADNPNAFLGHLGLSLNNLANRLKDLGQRAEALEAIQQAIEIRSKLADSNPAAFLPHLAVSLNNLANTLGDLGREEDALQAAQQTVKTCRELSTKRPDAFLPNMAMALNTLARILNALGRREMAAQAAREAAETSRKLAAQNPDAFLPDLATSLANLALCLNDLGQGQEARQAVQEAVDIRRKLSQQHPDAFLPSLARALSTLHICHKGLGHDRQAKEAIEEALTTLAPLFLRLPAAFAPLMAPMADDYVAATRALNQEPDHKLLDPIQAALKKLK